MKSLITSAAIAASIALTSFAASAIDLGEALSTANKVSDAISGKPPAPTAAETAATTATKILSGGDMTTQLMEAMSNPNVQSAVVSMLNAEQIQALITQFPELLTLAQ